MDPCGHCKEQLKKSQRGGPHAQLAKIGEPRVFKGNNARRYEEQDFQCLVCRSKFTWSSNRNDIAWSLWQG